MSEMMENVALAAEKQFLRDALDRVPKGDSFARMLIMGKLKALYRDEGKSPTSSIQKPSSP